MYIHTYVVDLPTKFKMVLFLRKMKLRNENDES